MKIQKVKISEIKENQDNPRKIQKDKLLKLIKSIKDFPEMLEYRMIVCYTDKKDGKYVPLGGNMRLKALKEIGATEVSIMLADEWTQEQRKKFIIKDNVNFGEWDFGILDKDFNFEAQIDFGIERNFSFKMAETKNFDENLDAKNNENIEETDDNFEANYENFSQNENKNEIQEEESKISQKDTSGELVISYRNIADKERIKKILKNFNISFSGK